jgi:hypothetical protein
MTEPEIEKTPRVDFHEISVDLFNRRNNKTTQLIGNNVPAFKIDGKRQWYQFEFLQPVFVQGISVLAEGYENWHEVDFEVFHIDGTNHIQTVKFDGSFSKLSVGKLATGFKFRPSERFSLLTTPKIVRVTVTGLSLEEFHAYEWAVKDHDDRARRLSEKEVLLADIDSKIATAQSEKASLESEVGKSRAEAETLTASLLSIRASIAEVEAKRDVISGDIRYLETERDTIRSDLVKAAGELKTLREELKIFPSEIAGFVREGNRSINWFIGISVPFAIIIGLVTYSLFSSAVDLTQIYKKDPTIEIWTVFLTRIPFVLVSLAILEVCGYIVGRLVFEIIRINRQRLNLSKLSIVAKDVASASANGLDFDKNEVYEKEVRLKMDLLREHMKEYIGQEFQYKGTFISSVATAVVNKVTGGKA